jgi:hypothetical protein
MKSVKLILSAKTGLILVLLAFAVTCMTYGTTNADPNSKVTTLSGKVLDKDTKRPIVYANVNLVGTSIGTVTNADGAFILKVPKDETQSMVSFNYIGYEKKSMAISEFSEATENTVLLSPEPIVLKEVIIRNNDPYQLISYALAKVPTNYSDVPEMNTGFYRESVKQNKKFVSVSEAILDVYKAPYNKELVEDRVKIYKGRKTEDISKLDTVVVKIQGGPKTVLYLDIVKNPYDLFSEDMIDNYILKFAGMTTKNGRDNYIIEFDQEDDPNLVLYAGKVYIDVQTLAFTGAEFGISQKNISRAADQLVRKKPATMRINIESANYVVDYEELNGVWYLKHALSELKFRCKWDRELFRSSYTTTMEVAITDRDPENINHFKMSETAGFSDILTDQVDYFKDDNFWGDYNIIKPDESIEDAIAKLNKKLIDRNPK